MFGSKWSVKFKPENNTRQLFHAFNKDYECDFMNRTDTFDAYIGKISHDVRVIADEEGIKAVAYTPLPVAGAAEPPKEIIDFVLDRPFIFAINTNQEYPVFVGVVENP